MKDFLKAEIDAIFSHSTSRAFLVFSSILLIFSIGYAKEYSLIAFWTFFYALIAHKFVVIRKLEDWSKYLVGNTLGAILYFFLDWISFIGWLLGVLLLLAEVQQRNLVEILSSSNLIYLKDLLYLSAGLSVLIFLMWVIQALVRKKHQD